MPVHSKNNILALFNIHNWQRLPTPPPPLPILRRPPYSIGYLLSSPPIFGLLPWLIVITSCVNLRHDIFLVTTKKSLSSLSTLVPEAPCCVVYVTRRQGHQRFHTDDEFPYHRHTHHTTLREQKTNSLI